MLVLFKSFQKCWESTAEHPHHHPEMRQGCASRINFLGHISYHFCGHLQNLGWMQIPWVLFEPSSDVSMSVQNTRLVTCVSGVWYMLLKAASFMAHLMVGHQEVMP